MGKVKDEDLVELLIGMAVRTGKPQRGIASNGETFWVRPSDRLDEVLKYLAGRDHAS